MRHQDHLDWVSGVAVVGTTNEEDVTTWNANLAYSLLDSFSPSQGFHILEGDPRSQTRFKSFS